MSLTTDRQSCWVSHSALLRVNLIIFQSLIGFYSLFCWCFGVWVFFFLLEVRGYLINHHFKVARVICIQIHNAARSTDNTGVCVISNPAHKELQQTGAAGEGCSESSFGAPRAAEFQAPLPPHPTLLRAPTSAELEENAVTQRHLLLIFRSIRAPV